MSIQDKCPNCGFLENLTGEGGCVCHDVKNPNRATWIIKRINEGLRITSENNAQLRSQVEELREENGLLQDSVTRQAELLVEANKVIRLFKRFRNTPIVDDDFPSIRDEVDHALATFIQNLHNIHSCGDINCKGYKGE